MARPTAALLDPSRYSFDCEITTRLADTDVNSHLNNVALAALIEESRVRFNVHAGLQEPLGTHSAMVVSNSIDYLAQAFYPAPVRCLAAIAEIGRSSWTTVQLLIQGERVVVFARCVLVCVSAGRSSPLPEAVRSGLERLMIK